MSFQFRAICIKEPTINGKPWDNRYCVKGFLPLPGDIVTVISRVITTSGTKVLLEWCDLYRRSDGQQAFWDEDCFRELTSVELKYGLRQAAKWTQHCQMPDWLVEANSYVELSSGPIAR